MGLPRELRTRHNMLRYMANDPKEEGLSTSQHWKSVHNRTGHQAKALLCSPKMPSIFVWH